MRFGNGNSVKRFGKGQSSLGRRKRSCTDRKGGRNKLPQQFSIRPFPVQARKGFGGGDGYASSFLHALMAGVPLNEALERGSASAAMLVASHACSKDMPTEEALLAFIAEEKAKYGTVVKKL